MAAGSLFNNFTKEPIITQNIINKVIEVKTNIDMSAQLYTNSNPGAVIDNTLLLKGPSAPPIESWNMALDSQSSNFNAGQFTYIAGSGNGGAEGYYDYSGLDYDHTAIDWEEYFDYNDPTGNPWAYPEGKP